MKKYEVRKSNEWGGDYHIKTFDSWVDARDYMERAERYDKGYYYYIRELKNE